MSAVIKFTDGTSYTGEFSDGQLNGSGQMIYANGDTYQGTYQNGNRSGTGTYTWKTGASYAGDWDADKMNGTGTYTYAFGDKLSGTFFKKSILLRKLSDQDTNRTIYLHNNDSIPVV